MEFLNQNALGIQTIFLGILVILTAFYVWWTKGILKSQEKSLEEIRRQGETATRAYVVARIIIRQKVLFILEIANEGKSAATNLKLTLDKDLYRYGKKESLINNFPLFSKTTVMFPPGSCFIVGLWTSLQCFGKERTPLCVNQFKVTAAYESLGREYKEEWDIDLEAYAEQIQPLYSLEESGQKIQEDLSRIRKAIEKSR